MFSFRFRHWKLCFFVFGMGLLYVYTREEPEAKLELEIEIEAKNYFRKDNAIHLRKRLLLINTSKCHIPAFDLWNNDVIEARRYYRKLSFYKRCQKHPRITRIENNKLIINETVLQSELKLTLADVTCCYRSIERMEQSYANYNSDADNHYGYSRKCHRMRRITTITSRFVYVNCFRHVDYNDDDKVEAVYENFHATPLIPLLIPDNNDPLQSRDFGVAQMKNLTLEVDKENTRLPNSFWKSDTSILSKVLYWSRCGRSNFNRTSSLSDMDKDAMGMCRRVQKFGPLPHVLIIGIESTSRMNFRRFMNKSVEMLESIGAVEMKGFSKVGHDTLANILPLLTSTSLQESWATCSKYDSVRNAYDKCPFIWKDFHRQSYVTAYLEDSPTKAIFNHKRTGFVKAPVDFYLRPFMLAAYMDNKKAMPLDKGRSIDCIGYKRPEEVVLNFAFDLMRSAERRHTPTFTVTWLSDLTNSKHNALEVLDGRLSKMIRKLKKVGILSKTILLVMGDQGRRTGSFRQTLTGWHEEKLPALWISLPKSYRKQRRHFQDALLHNAKQLVTPYDIHATLKHVLTINLNKKLSSFPDISTNREANKTRPRRGISLFTRHPSRSCKEASIPPEHCPCNLRTDILIGKRTVNKAISTANETIYYLLPRQCRRLNLGQVFGMAVLVHPRNMNSLDKENGDLKSGDILVLLSKSKVGNVILESGVQYKYQRPMFRNTTYFVRTNAMEEDPHCVHVNHPMANLCVCGKSKSEENFKDSDDYVLV